MSILHSSCVVATLSIFAAACANPPQARTSLRASGDPLGCGSLEQADSSPVAGAIDLEVAALSEEDLPGMPEEDEPSRDGPVGVQLSFPVPEGWSQAWLERRLGCYRQGALPTGSDPLLVEAAHVSVVSARGRFVINVVSDDHLVSEQIVTAAQNMVERSESSFAVR